MVWWKTALLVIGVAVGVAVLATAVFAPQVFVVPALGLVGFAATGPVAGSFAAFIQSLIGNVAAGSLFAGVQGVTMGAAVSAFIKVIAGGVSTFLAALLAAIFLQGDK